jgi:hypothetical protein
MDLHAKSRPAILSVLHLPVINAYMSISGSSRRVSFETAMTGRAEVCGSSAPAIDGLAGNMKQTVAAAKTCRQECIVRLA